METNNLKAAQALIDAFNAHNLSTWEQTLSEDFVGEYPMARGLGKEQAKAYNQAFVVAFPDLKFSVHHSIANGNTVALHWTGTGTHSNPLQTLSGQIIPATGKSAVLSGVFVVDVKDGKIVRERSYWDELELMAQLGVLPG